MWTTLVLTFILMPNGFLNLVNFISKLKGCLVCFINITFYGSLKRYAASDLGLHCLPMPLLWDAKQ